MASKKLTPAQHAKQIKALKEHHAKVKSGEKVISRSSTYKVKPKSQKQFGSIIKDLERLQSDASKVIERALMGGLLPEQEVFKGSPEDKQEILDTDPSATFTTIELDNGKTVEVVERYVPVNPKRTDMAKWIVNQYNASVKAADDSRLRELELLRKQAEAEEKGLIAKESQQEKAKAAAAKGKHIQSVTDYITADQDFEEPDFVYDEFDDSEDENFKEFDGK